MSDTSDRVPDVIESRRRRRRPPRREYALLAVVVAVGLAVATSEVLTAREERRTPASPSSAPGEQASQSPSSEDTSSARPTAPPREALMFGPPTDLPVAMGSRIFHGHRQIQIAADEQISELKAAKDGYLVQSGGYGSTPQRLGLAREGQPYRRLMRGDIAGFAVDIDAGRVAWAVPAEDGSRTRLALVRLPSGARVARRVVDGPWRLVGFAEKGLVITSMLFPGAPPSVWDPEAGRVSQMPVPDPAAATRILTMQQGGGLLLLTDDEGRCITAVSTSRPEVALWRRCDTDVMFADVSPGGSRLILADSSDGEPDVVTVLDSSSGATLQQWVLPEYANLASAAWEDGRHVLLFVGPVVRGDDARSPLIRCRVGAGACEHVPTPDDDFVTAIAHH